MEDIFPRAKAWLAENRPWAHSLLSGVGAEDAAIRRKLRKDVLRAIERAENGIRQGRKGFRPKKWWSAFTPDAGVPRFITNEQFAKDTLTLMSKLPPDITGVVGVARSGVQPASMIALMLHVPLIVVRHHQADWFPAGNGWRLNEGAPKHRGTTLVVDDTTMTGNSLKRTQHVLADMPGKKLYAAVYVNPAAKAKPDLWAVDLPWPHLLQWNLFNSVLMDSCAFDFDGVLCHDCPRGDDDDGPRYEAFLREVRPLHLVRKRRIKLIVTSRMEKYRPQTMAWLQKWGVRVERMVMGSWSTLRERRADDVAAFKARHLNQWFGKRPKIKPKMFIESDPRQAKRIAELTSGLVVCPNGQCFQETEL